MRGAFRLMERCLWAIGFMALAVWIAVWLNARQQQAEGSRELDRFLSGDKSSVTPSRSDAHSTPGSVPKLAQGVLIGRIEIPRLKMSTVVFEGTGDDVLRIGVGHMAGSPLPGEQGNVVLAAHRDTYFRPLRNIRERDRIDVVTPAGTRRYRVESMMIVSPEHTEVLAQGPGTTLTLVTCYPFAWFGHAPKRFIVRAEEVDDRRTAPPVANKSVQAPIVAKGSGDHSARKAIITTVANEPAEELVVAPASEAEEEVVEPAPLPNGNRVVRGFKKLNPRRLFAKRAGV
jgi:sortase A